MKDVLFDFLWAVLISARDAGVKSAAIRSLVRFVGTNEASQEHLEEAVEAIGSVVGSSWDPEPSVRADAVEALGQIQSILGLAAVVESLVDDSMFVREKARESLFKILEIASTDEIMDTADHLIDLLARLGSRGSAHVLSIILQVSQLNDEVSSWVKSQLESLSKTSWDMNLRRELESVLAGFSHLG